ncbi:hypothetical protein PZA11_005921 [Diplocarpon coronariae]
MHSRRSHTKSRLGCFECKKRKVKCDERKPSCSYCLRSIGIGPCVYPSHAGGQAEARGSEGSRRQSSASSPTSELGNAAAASRPAFDLLDLTLMSHYTAVTSISMFAGEPQQKVWQRDIPMQAGAHALLMHGLLSVAALHLAFLEPDKASIYRPRAQNHHNVGIHLYNLEIRNITAENSHILFAFGILLVIWMYASPVVVAHEKRQLHEIIDLLELVLQSIAGKPIGSMADVVPPAEPATANQEECIAVGQKIEELKLRVPEPGYERAIKQLRDVLLDSVARPQDISVVTFWPATVDDEFWIRLRNQESKAAFVFVHYALVLRKYEAQWWWVRGWSKGIVDAVGNALTDFDKVSLGWENFLSSLQE